MKVYFSTPSYCIQGLTSDFEELKKLVLLPCDTDEFYEQNKIPRSAIDIACCYYGEEEISKGHVLIEVNPHFFQEDDLARQLILLHELIHACQRTNELLQLNQKYLIDGVNDLIKIKSEYLEHKPEDDYYNYVFRKKTNNIDEMSGWIFEIWNELLLKQDYGQHLEKKHETTYKLITKGIPDDAYKDFGTWKKFPIFSQLVRATYLEKISRGTKISSKYKKLAEKWEKILSDSTSAEDFEELMSNLDSLTNVDDFSKAGLEKLEEAYDKMIKMMKNEAKKDYLE